MVTKATSPTTNPSAPLGRFHTGLTGIWQYSARILADNPQISGIYRGIGDLGNKVELSTSNQSVLKDGPPTIEKKAVFSISYILGFLTDTNAKTGISQPGRVLDNRGR